MLLDFMRTILNHECPWDSIVPFFDKEEFHGRFLNLCPS